MNIDTIKTMLGLNIDVRFSKSQTEALLDFIESQQKAIDDKNSELDKQIITLFDRNVKLSQQLDSLNKGCPYCGGEIKGK